MSNNHNFDFRGLFVLDMANNHQGSIDHGKAIIRSAAEIARKNDVRAAIKFQFRQLDTFIHPAHRNNSDNKHIPRFISTELKQREYQKLLDEVRAQGMLAMCTPFDEESVDIIREMGFDLIKIASCSALDWPLVEKITDSGLPVVCSTGGLRLEQIDDLVSLFLHRGTCFGLMYCVSIYPTLPEFCHLNMIDIMRRRYRDIPIGWSTHENPDDLAPVHVAVSKGAVMFERHIGIEADKIKLNAYSSTPEQLDLWMKAYRYAQEICGGEAVRDVAPVEAEALNSLRRGIYAKKTIKKGATIERGQVYFAMPYTEGALSSGQWRNGIVAKSEIKPDAPVMANEVAIPSPPKSSLLKSAVHEVKALLNEARVVLNSEFDVEYSHHYGVENFRKYGAVIINCINRGYCKKIIVQLPGQYHPSHFHKRKEETFQVLYGTLRAEVEGHEKLLQPGETCLVQPGVWHSFWTETGCIFEEVSSTHYNDDSFYADKEINRLDRADRKTQVDHWGRFELENVLAKNG